MVSVIVPVYNAEKDLSRCLESILSQTYKDLEIILVDDGATDGSPRICDDYAVKDSRIKVIHQKNGGISNARNTGLKNAKGEYIQFVDHDDVVHPQMVEILLSLLESGDYDFSMCYGESIYDFDLLNARIALRLDTTNTEELSRDLCMKELFLGCPEYRVQYLFVWNKLYRKELLENLYFANTEAEDVEFNNRVYLRMDKAVLLKTNLYFWIQRKESVSHQGLSLRFVNILSSYMDCLNAISKDNRLYRSFCLRRIYRLMLSKRYWTLGTKYNEILTKICKVTLKQTSKEWLKNTYIPIRERIVLLLFNYCPFLYRFYIKVISF